MMRGAGTFLGPISLVLGLKFPQPALANPPFTYQELERIIETSSITSLEELLPRLPAEFRAGYTLMYRSRNLQAASEENPRAILFGQDGTLTCAFTLSLHCALSPEQLSAVQASGRPLEQDTDLERIFSHLRRVSKRYSSTETRWKPTITGFS